MKLQISLSADPSFKKGDRVVCKIAKNEWYLGTVMRAGAKLKVEFDDGFDATIEPEDFKHVKMLVKPKKLKRALTDIEAKLLYEVKKTLKEAVTKKVVTKPETKKKPLVPEKKPAKVIVEPPKKKPFVPATPPKPVVKSPIAAPTPIKKPAPPVVTKPIETPVEKPVVKPAPIVTPKPAERQYKNNWTVQINAVTAKHWKYIVLDDPASHTFKFASSSMATSTQEALTRALMDMKGETFTIELKTFAEPGKTANVHVLKNLTVENSQAKLAELMKALQPPPEKKPEPVKPVAPTTPTSSTWSVTLVPNHEGKWSYAVKDAEVKPLFVRVSDYMYSNAVQAYHAAIREFKASVHPFKLKIAEELSGNAIVRSAVADRMLETSGLRFVEMWHAKNEEGKDDPEEKAVHRRLFVGPNADNAWRFYVTDDTGFTEESPFEFKTMKDAFEEGLLYIPGTLDLTVADKVFGPRNSVVSKQDFDNITSAKARVIVENLMRTKFGGLTPPENLFDPTRTGKVISKALYETVGDPVAFAKARDGSDLEKLNYLNAVYKRAVDAIFQNRMRMPRIRFLKEQQATSFRLRGHWHPRDREIAISRRLFNASEIHVLNTFVHEMCHQAVTDIDRAIDPNGGHGPHWIRWMKIAGIPPERYDMTDNIEYMDDAERLKTEAIRRERERVMNENHRTPVKSPSTLEIGTPVQFYQPGDFKWIQGVAIGVFNTKFVMMSRLDGYHWNLGNQGRNTLYHLDSSEAEQDFFSSEWQEAARAFAERKGKITEAKRRQRKMKKQYGYSV